MMNNHFIKNIEIKDFKCFDNFKAEDFSRVNLIGGKNNVGKTTFLEACFVGSSAKDINSFSTALIAGKYRRERLNHSFVEKINFLSYLEMANGVFISSNKGKVSFRVNDEGGVKSYQFSIDEETKKINVNIFTHQMSTIENVNFISSLGPNDKTLVSRYSSLQKNDKEEYLNRVLQKVDSRIESFKVIEDIPQCKVNSKYIEIADMGGGVRHLVIIIASLYSSKDGHVFIDEIGNGIHYTILDDIWNIIFSLCEELNIQVFATTHSKECIESFNRVQLKLKDKQSSYFELAKEKNTNKIFMSALPPSQLEYELSHKGKFRGE